MGRKDSILDADGKILQEGDSVILLNAPDELLSDLPSEDQAAIKTQTGMAMSVQGFDEHSHVELAFTSEDKIIPFIRAKSLCLRKLT